MVESALSRIADDSESCVVPFVQASVEPGTQVRTDGSAAYRSLKNLAMTTSAKSCSARRSPADVSMAGVHRVASLVKRWILGTHHGSVQPGHLDAYLDEFVFRFNRRTSSSRGMLFYRLLQQAVGTDPVTYEDVVGAPHPQNKRRYSWMDIQGAGSPGAKPIPLMERTVFSWTSPAIAAPAPAPSRLSDGGQDAATVGRPPPRRAGNPASGALARP